MALVDELKVCSKCSLEKSTNDFHFRKDNGVFRKECKSCYRLQKKRHYLHNKEKCLIRAKRYYNTNLEKVIVYKKLHTLKNKEYYKQYNKLRYQRNKEKILKAQKQYYLINKEYINTRNTEYRKTHRHLINKSLARKKKTDLNYKLKCCLRSRIRLAVKRNSKAGSTVKDLGCSINDFKLYLESKFKDGMTWENWSRNGWHIDHILPLASFDLTKREDFLKACHYTNLQPLWAKENLDKRMVDGTC